MGIVEDKGKLKEMQSCDKAECTANDLGKEHSRDRIEEWCVRSSLNV